MHELGFKQVYVCDWAESSFESLREKTDGFPEDHLICGDFFEISDRFEMIIEQTFFCSIQPNRRNEYVKHASQLLEGNGLLTGLFFASQFQRQGPPFGGTEEEYRILFEPFFRVEMMKLSQNSILPRLGNELHFKMKKK